MAMAVLVNENTAGPGELFACDLRDFDKAFLVGVQTEGVGIAQDVFTLEDGTAVVLTTSMILPYKSDSFQDKGLTPDYEVALDTNLVGTAPELLDEGKDAQLQKALSELASR